MSALTAYAGRRLTNREIGARLAVGTKLARYGSVGMSPDGLASMRAALRARAWRHHNRQKSFCKFGHAFTVANTYLYRCRRHCRACIERRKRLWRTRRPEWVAGTTGRVNVAVHDRYYRATKQWLKAAMLVAHPDKGGTSVKFRAARNAYERFHKQERTWYMSLHMHPPTA